MSRLKRFLHLERARGGAPAEADAAPRPATAERIEGVLGPPASPAPSAPRASGAGLDRFGAEPPPRLELLDAAAGAQPFTRCMQCGMDHGVFAAECTGCGARLDTEAQRAFNARLWAERQAEAAREAEAEAERREVAARAEADLARQRRALGETLAREVGARERRRLGVEGWSGWGGRRGGGGFEPGELSAPLGLRLLRALPDWRWQLGAVAAALAVVGGLLAYGLRGHAGALLAAVLLVVVLVAPGWRANGT